MSKIHGNKKFNTYDLSGSFGIGYTRKNEEFYFDLEDYDKIKYHCWYIETRGRVCARNSKGGTPLKLHRVILNNPELSMDIDHIDHDQSDNRKSNLRICTHTENLHNIRIPKTNTSGTIGVYFNKNTERYISRIEYNKKIIRLGHFINEKDAIVARLKAEKKYYKEFAPQKHLFKKYDI